MNKLLTVLALSTLLFSCAEAPSPQLTYYLLNTPVVTPVKQLPEKNNTGLVIDEIVLPQYLKQPSLVMLMAENQLHFSHYHLWAESLEQSIHKVLWLLLTYPEQATQDNLFNKLHVTVEIDNFFPSEQGKVILSGRYWLTTSGSKVNKKLYKKYEYEFNFTQNINADGYSQAVKQMLDLLEQLSKEINKKAIVLFAH